MSGCPAIGDDFDYAVDPVDLGIDEIYKMKADILGLNTFEIKCVSVDKIDKFFFGELSEDWIYWQKHFSDTPVVKDWDLYEITKDDRDCSWLSGGWSFLDYYLGCYFAGIGCLSEFNYSDAGRIGWESRCGGWSAEFMAEDKYLIVSFG